MDDKEQLYYKIGLIMHVAQSIEYNLSKLVALNNFYNLLCSGKNILFNSESFLRESEDLYNELSRKPLGYTVEEAKNTKLFDDDFLNRLNKALHKRNYYAHRFFKEDLKDNNVSNNPKMYLSELDYTVKSLSKINNEVADQFVNLKNKIKK